VVVLNARNELVQIVRKDVLIVWVHYVAVSRKIRMDHVVLLQLLLISNIRNVISAMMHLNIAMIVTAGVKNVKSITVFHARNSWALLRRPHAIIVV